MTRAGTPAILCLATAAALSLGCGKDHAPAPSPAAPPPPDVLRVTGRDGALPPNPEEAAPALPDAGAQQEGEWAMTGSYKIVLDEIVPCAPAAAAAAETAGPDSAGATARSWVGALVRVGALVNEFVLSPRDFTLERHGVIIQATYVNQPSLPACLPLLPVKQLRANQIARGFALFDVPARFRNQSTDPFVLAYRPTRWGGAKRTEFEVPPCLDACASKKSGADLEQKKQRGPLPKHPRKKS